MFSRYERFNIIMLPAPGVDCRNRVAFSNYGRPPGKSIGCPNAQYRKSTQVGVQHTIMTWIRIIPFSEASEELRQAMEGQKSLYPQEYAVPIHPSEGGGSQIVASHSLIPQALHHAFSTFGALMSPDLPLTRRHHEMIATMVSVTNRCVY
jgi:hypothetical protein